VTAEQDRKPTVKMLAGKGLTTRQIAEVTGWDHVTISRDLRETKTGVSNETKSVSNETPSAITGNPEDSLTNTGNPEELSLQKRRNEKQHRQRLPILAAFGTLQRYDPAKGLKSIAVANAGITYFTQAKDASKLFTAIETKIMEQARYVVWRDGVIEHGGDRKSKLRPCNIDLMPDADPGHLVAHRWRRRLCTKTNNGTVIDPQKIGRELEAAQRRCLRVCELEHISTIRGTEGTGEFERYTPAQYIEAARQVLGEIDLDPASSAMAQKTVKAKKYYTAKTDGLSHEWRGRVWLNPPYHRDLMPAFVNKMISEFGSGRVTAAIMLTNNCTDTDWFVAAHGSCSAICFTRGRVKFMEPNGVQMAPTQGQAFFYYGNDVAGFASVFSRFGVGVTPSWSV
jgi:phage N-6-adenine-methyltransferase